MIAPIVVGLEGGPTPQVASDGRKERRKQGVRLRPARRQSELPVHTTAKRLSLRGQVDYIRQLRGETSPHPRARMSGRPQRG